MCYNIKVVGVWRRLVARYLGVVEAVGSSPVTPTMKSLQFSVRTFCFMLITIIYKYKKISPAKSRGDLLYRYLFRLLSPYFLIVSR